MNKQIILLSVIVVIAIFGNCKLYASSPCQQKAKQTIDDSVMVEKIAFESWRNGNAEIYTMNDDGSGVKRLTTNSGEDRTPGFSRDGRKIVFSSNRDGNYELYKMNNDGSAQERITSLPASDEWTPDWSPDHNKIAYVISPIENALVSEIHIMNADGTGDTTITSNTSGDSRPIWSPDGSKILFYSKRDGHYEIYVMNADGSDQTRLTYTSTNAVYGQWSPNGMKIVYNDVTISTMTGQIHVMNSDGSNDTVLTNSSGINEDPCWSTDGKSIVFQSNRNGNYEVYMMNADGSNQHNLTNNSSWDSWPSWGTVRIPLKKYLGQTPPDTIPKRFPPTSLLATSTLWWHGSPSFSPDGKEMFFVKYNATKSRGNMEMYYMKIVNGEWSSPMRPSFASDSGDNSPVFSSNGNRLLFTSYRDGGIKIYQVTRVDTGWSIPELVNMDYQSLPGLFGWDISLTHDETMYFEIYTPGTWMDIYRSTLENGRYAHFEKLPDQVNSASNDATPYIDSEEQYIIFMSNRPGGYGNHDLYISFKKPDGTWASVQNLGSKINGSNEDSFPLLSPDGKYFFFNTAKASSGDRGYNAYWINASVIENLRPVTNVNDETGSLPSKLKLYSNYPNPFNPTTTIKFDIQKSALVRFEVYNILGVLVKTLVNEQKDAGSYSIIWDGTDNLNKQVSSGLYFCQLTSGNINQIIKALLLK
jgi:Tol biopolymer transport system component